LRSLPVLVQFARDSIATLTRLHATQGSFVVLRYPHRPWSDRSILAFISDRDLYRTVASNPEAWRTAAVSMRAFKKHASYRLSMSVTRLQGARHEHYRRILSGPLSRPSVAAMSEAMAAIARRAVESWPRDRVIDLVPAIAELMQEVVIDLLFGGDFTRVRPIARMVDCAVAAARPFPGTAFFRWLRVSPELERAINAWMEQKKGILDPDDILSRLVNNPDEYGDAPDKDLIGSVLVFTFGAAYETCQNALLWTLILLAQHPRIAADLAEEIEGATGSGPTSAEKLSRLPLLDGVAKEGMRLFPPVPLQTRRSRIETELGGFPIPAGTRLIVSAYLINRDPDIYDEPYKFMPRRWRSLEASPFEWPVFGAGNRMCPGSLFGTQMLKAVLAAILSTHRVELAAGARIDHRCALTLTPHPKVPVILRKKGALTRSIPLEGTINDLVDLRAVGR
jgi:cytochrome P450